MIYPDTDPDKWAEIYDLAGEPLECVNCGKLLKREIPFAYGNIRGLKSAPHGCPERYDHTVSRSVSKEDRAVIQALFERFRGNV